MVRNQERRTQWAVNKSQEYLDSATDNIMAGRTFPAAEEIFKCVESCLTALLYNEGIVKIEYHEYGGNLTGRQALQPLIRENLLRRGIISDEEYQTYRRLVTDLHHEGYQPGKTFDSNDLRAYSGFAEDLLIKTRTKIA